ncbi:hypothetical protein IWW50_000775 [Coemansia erecta]|nr:hypothetical protein IWW50_000775 [Coemansia erecta]
MSDDVIRSVLSGVKGGILVKNGKRTSCELGVSTSQGSYVNKDCLDYTPNGDIDNSTNYEVYLDGGLDGKPIKYTVTDYHRVTDNSKTLSNNYIYLWYNKQTDRTWTNMMSPVLSYNWDVIVYVRRMLRDMDKMEWDAPEFVSLGSDYDGSCVSMSGLFETYPSYFLCKAATVPTPTKDLSPCPLPYGTVYGITDRKAHLMGIYSHTVVNAGSTMCNATASRAYYTALYRHVNTMNVDYKWTMNYDPDVFGANQSTYPRDYKMKEQVFAPKNADVKVVRGDYFRAQSSTITFPTADDSSEASKFNDDDDDDGDDDDNGSDVSDSDNSNASKGSDNDDKKDNRTSIIIGVCVGVGGLFLLGGIVFAIWWWRERHRGSVDPMSRNEYQSMLETDLGTLSVQGGQQTTPQTPHAPHTPQAGLSAADRDIIAEYDLPPVYDDPVDDPFSSKAKESPQQLAPNSAVNTNGVSRDNTLTPNTHQY